MCVFLVSLPILPKVTSFSYSTIWVMLVRVMVFNATFINIAVISWRSVLLVEKTGVPREKKNRHAASH